MKCLILAGGKGGRLWPLSRDNYPKQFIPIQKNHSIFQETIANNIALCDEFIIVSNYEYRHLLKNQMRSFQGLTYRYIFEEEGRDTTAAVALACMTVAPSEIIYLVTANQIIKGDSYREDVLTAKSIAQSGRIVILKGKGNTPAKPENMLLFQAGDFLYELECLMPEFYENCLEINRFYKNKGKDICFKKDELMKLQPIDVTESILKKTKLAREVECNFETQSLNELEDLDSFEYSSKGAILEYECSDNLVINETDDQLILANGLENTVIVNTQDALYVGRRGHAGQLKQIFQEYPEYGKYIEKNKIAYRHWGTYETIINEPGYSVRRVKINSGATIYSHKHLHRKERWIIISGLARITLDGKTEEYGAGDCISVEMNQVHQLSNKGDDILVLIEVATGKIVFEEDMVSVQSKDLTEAELGMPQDLMVKLRPAFKDYLWGGTKIRDYLGKKCDYQHIAESWEVSAHEDGQCIVDSGRYKGMKFGEYLNVIGKEKLGWKCSSMREFPILIKFIDAKDNLSIQVHPDDDYAWEMEHDNGKNEMWYVLEAEEGAGIYLGFNRDVTVNEVRDAVQKNRICELLQWIPVKKGDIFFISAGIVHAIGKGILICEIQQSSNITYRLYDYNRRDKYGRCRELHLEKALNVIKYKKTIITDKNDLKSQNTLVCKYFMCMKHEIREEKCIYIDDSSFVVIVCIDGEGYIQINHEKLHLKYGESLFVPANTAKIFASGDMILLVIQL